MMSGRVRGAVSGTWVLEAKARILRKECKM